MKRFYCETNGNNFVAYVGEDGIAFIVNDCNECDISTLDKAKTVLADSELNGYTDYVDCVKMLGLNYDEEEDDTTIITIPWNSYYSIDNWSDIEAQAYAEHDRTVITEF